MSLDLVDNAGLSNPRQQNLPSEQGWRFIPLVIVLSAVSSFCFHIISLPPQLTPYLAALLILAWWAILSIIYLRFARVTSSTGELWRWLLVTPGIRGRCLAGLALGLILVDLLHSLLPMYCCLGLLWPVLLVSLRKARPVAGGRHWKLLVLGAIILWHLCLLAICVKTNMAGLIDANDPHFPNPCHWMHLAFISPQHAFIFWQLFSEVLIATVVFYGGLLAVGGTAVFRELPRALPVGEGEPGKSLVSQTLAYWMKPLVITYMAHAVALGPLYAHPKTALTIAVLLTTLAYALAQTRLVRQWLTCGIGEKALPAPETMPPTTRNVKWAYPLLGLLILIGCLVLVEVHQPFFFTQDDAFALGTPLALHACRSLWQGVFCTWNPYQYMGMPIASNPQSFFLYPPLYLAYFIARDVLHNEYLLNEIFCIMHIIAAYFVLDRWTCYLGLRRPLALAATLSFILSGYVLVLGRSWGTVMITCLWMIPLAIALTTLQRRQVGLPWLLGTGAVFGASFYVGYPQGWSYNLLFFLMALFILFRTRSLTKSKLYFATAALLLGLAISAPLLVPQTLEAKRLYANRTVGKDFGIQRAFTDILLPYPLAKLTVKPGEPTFCQYAAMMWGGPVNKAYRGELYYSGTFFLGIMLAVLLLSIGFRWKTPDIIAANIWFVCGVLVFILALGPAGALWSAQKMFPFFAKFRGVFKMLGYLNLFAIVGAAIFVERWLRAARHPARWARIILLAVCAVMVYHCTLRFNSFFTYGDKPYPPLPPAMRTLFAMNNTRTPARIIGIGQYRNDYPGYVFNLKHNFPTVYGLYTVNGYDPLITDMPESKFIATQLDNNFFLASQKYGIRWVITARSSHPENEDEGSIAEARAANYETIVRKKHHAKLMLKLAGLSRLGTQIS